MGSKSPGLWKHLKGGGNVERLGVSDSWPRLHRWMCTDHHIQIWVCHLHNPTSVTSRLCTSRSSNFKHRHHLKYWPTGDPCITHCCSCLWEFPWSISAVRSFEVALYVHLSHPGPLKILWLLDFPSLLSGWYSIVSVGPRNNIPTQS